MMSSRRSLFELDQNEHVAKTNSPTKPSKVEHPCSSEDKENICDGSDHENIHPTGEPPAIKVEPAETLPGKVQNADKSFSCEDHQNAETPIPDSVGELPEMTSGPKKSFKPRVSLLETFDPLFKQDDEEEVFYSPLDPKKFPENQNNALTKEISAYNSCDNFQLALDSSCQEDQNEQNFETDSIEEETNKYYSPGNNPAVLRLIDITLHEQNSTPDRLVEGLGSFDSQEDSLFDEEINLVSGENSPHKQEPSSNVQKDSTFDADTTFNADSGLIVENTSVCKGEQTTPIKENNEAHEELTVNEGPNKSLDISLGDTSISVNSSLVVDEKTAPNDNSSLSINDKSFVHESKIDSVPNNNTESNSSYSKEQSLVEEQLPVKDVSFTVEEKSALVEKNQLPAKDVSFNVKEQSDPIEGHPSPVKDVSFTVEEKSTLIEENQSPAKDVSFTVKEQSAPIEGNPSPVKDVSFTIEEKSASVEENQLPAKDVSSTVKEQSAPIEGNPSPVKDVSFTIEEKSASVEENQLPAKDVSFAVKEQSAPIEGNPSPVKDVSFTIEEKSASVEENQLPAKDVSFAVKEQSAPIEGNPSPVKDVSFTIEEKSASVEENQLPAKDVSFTVKEQSAPIEGHPSPVKDVSFTVEEKSASVEENQLPVKDVSFTVKEQSAPIEGHPSPVKDVSFSVEEKSASIEENQSPPKDVSFTVKEQSAPIEGDPSPVKDVSFTVEEKSAPIEENQSPAKDVSFTVKEQSAPIEGHQSPVKDVSFTVEKESVPVVANSSDILVSGNQIVQENNFVCEEDQISELLNRVSLGPDLIHKHTNANEPTESVDIDQSVQVEHSSSEIKIEDSLVIKENQPLSTSESQIKPDLLVQPVEASITPEEKQPIENSSFTLPEDKSVSAADITIENLDKEKDGYTGSEDVAVKLTQDSFVLDNKQVVSDSLNITFEGTCANNSIPVIKEASEELIEVKDSVTADANTTIEIKSPKQPNLRTSTNKISPIKIPDPQVFVEENLNSSTDHRPVSPLLSIKKQCEAELNRTFSEEEKKLNETFEQEKRLSKSFKTEATPKHNKHLNRSFHQEKHTLEESIQEKVDQQLCSLYEEVQSINVEPVDNQRMADISSIEQENFDLKMQLKQLQEMADKVPVLEQALCDVKLQLNQSQQAVASLELQLRQKEEVIIKSQSEFQKKEQASRQEIKQLVEKLDTLNDSKKGTEEVEELKETIEKMKVREEKLLAQVSMKSIDESTYKQTIEEFSKINEKSLSELEKLREEYKLTKRHLATLEMSFSDVHQKYERSKAIIAGYKNNEEVLTQSLAISEEEVRKSNEKYDTLKAHAKSQIEKSNRDLALQREKYQADIQKLTTNIKRLEIKNGSLNLALEQKAKECAAYASLCEEMTGRAENT